MLRWLGLIATVVQVVATTLFDRLQGRRRHPLWDFSMELTHRLMARVVRFSYTDLRMVRQLTMVGSASPPMRSRVQTRRVVVGGVPSEVHLPRNARGPTLLYFHGGGYAVCGPRTHRDLAARLAWSAGCRVVVPDYRKAPEDPFPAAVDDALAVCAALRADGVEELWLGGDSAGGGLAACTLLALRDRGLPMVDGAVLMSPWVDLTDDGHAPQLEEPDDYISPAVLAEFARHYVGETDPADPRVSPIRADLSGLPPTLVVLGGAETMRDQGERFVARAQAAGSPVVLDVAEGMVHVYAAFAMVSAVGRAAIRRMGAFVRGTVERAGPIRSSGTFP